MSSTFTLVDAFHADESAFADTPALHIPNDDHPYSLTYGQLHRHCQKLAAALTATLSLQRGDILTLVLPNGLPFVATFLAAAGLGWTVAPLNPAYNTKEIDFYIADTASRAVLVMSDPTQRKPAVDAAFAHHCRVLAVVEPSDAHTPPQLVELFADGREEPVHLPVDLASLGEPGRQAWPAQPDDVALVLHTSGTTGRPKCVPLTHRNIRRSTVNITSTYQLSPSDVAMVVMPLFHVHGLIASLLSTLTSGGACILPSRFSARTFWAQAKAFHATWYSAVPTIHTILLRTSVPEQLPPLRFIRSASSSLAPFTLHQLVDTFGAPVLEAYAMTEAAHQMCSNPLPPAQCCPGTVGQPQGVQVSIRDEHGHPLPTGQEGEVCIRGENVTAGYRDNPEANRVSFFPPTAEEEEIEGQSTEDSRVRREWFRTGDRGRLDAQHYLTLTGRIKELINRGGEKISPIEIDAVLLACPGVQDAVSFAAPDDVYGEVVHCAIVSSHLTLPADADAQANETTRIIAHCRDKLAEFKLPSCIHYLAEIPKTATGKVQRRLVAQHIQQQQRAE